ncbi:MAG: glycosyltransferase [Desulfovibrio sp.]|nr:glycosyltransferase [Desulfovibrio sp.]
MPAGARLRPPVDYYARLPGIYAAADFNLCLTSLQLPRGLSQRHFDVWTAGGLALSDATPGLALFPPELTRPITFTQPKDIADLASRLGKGEERRRLIRDWQACLYERHCYRHRIESILEQFTLEAVA